MNDPVVEYITLFLLGVLLCWLFLLFNEDYVS